MTLHEYMKAKKISDESLAEILRKDRTLIGRYRRGAVTPPPSVISKIEVITEGAVTLADWVRPKEASAQASGAAA